MVSPTASSAFARPDLAAAFMEFELEANIRGMAALQVMPVFPTTRSSGQFAKIETEYLLKLADSVARAPGGGYNRGNFKTTPVNFDCKEYGWEEPVDDRQASIYGTYFAAEMVANMRALNQVMMALEKRVRDLVIDTGTYTGSALTTGVSTEWSTHASATPIADVIAAAEKVRQGIGVTANAMVISRKVWNNVRQCDEVVDLLKYTGNQGSAAPGNITPQAVAAMMGLDMIVVAGGIYDSGTKGQSTTLADLWDDEYAFVYRAARTMDLAEPCLGRVFRYTGDGIGDGPTVESYRDETKRSNIVRVRDDTDEKLLYTQAGHLLSNVTA
jgi:hypothetical protein